MKIGGILKEIVVTQARENALWQDTFCSQHPKAIFLLSKKN